MSYPRVVLICGIVVGLAGLGFGVASVMAGRYSYVVMGVLMGVGGLVMVISGAVLQSRERRG